MEFEVHWWEGGMGEGMGDRREEENFGRLEKSLRAI